MKRGGEMRFLSANGHVTDRRPPSVSADSRQEEDSEQYRQHEYMHTHIPARPHVPQRTALD